MNFSETTPVDSIGMLPPFRNIITANIKASISQFSFILTNCSFIVILLHFIGKQPIYKYLLMTSNWLEVMSIFLLFYQTCNEINQQCKNSSCKKPQCNVWLSNAFCLNQCNRRCCNFFHNHKLLI